MFIGLWPGGTVYFCPNCAGSLSPDGHLGMKFWFYRTIPGEVIIEGQRIDERAAVVELDTLRGPADGYGETGFHPAELDFPGQACWEVTARIGGANMTFVTLVIWVPFAPLWPGWLPEGLHLDGGPDLSGYPTTFGLVFRAGDGGEVNVETSQTPWKAPDSSTLQGAVMVNAEPGACFLGEGSEPDAGALIWSSGDLHYRIRFEGLILTCRDLIQVAFPPGRSP